MRYKVQANIIPNDSSGFIQIEPLIRWVDADSHSEAAALVLLDNPEIDCSIWVVDTDYKMGVYPLDLTRLQADFIVGLRHYEEKS